METTAGGRSQPELQEKLAAYQTLCERRERVANQLRKTESEKESVSSRIYDKVRADYQAELDVITQELEPLKEEIATVRSELETELAGVEEEIRRGEDMITEAGFRHRVGEFDESTLAQATAGIESELKEWRERRAKLEEQLGRLDRRRPSRSADTAATPGAGPEPAPDPAPADAVPAGTTPARSAANPASPASPADAAPENPQEWFGEIPSSEPTETEPARPAVAVADETDEDPLAALADPSEEKTSPPASPAGACLLITTGAHEGRTIPLLPMTMSIGREHDNNIELKDPEVARYHARIVYENGEFSIQDMDSTSGTFVNGRKATQVPLVHGDRIRVGETELTFTFAP